MTLLGQLTTGTAMLSISILIHIACVAIGTPMLKSAAHRIRGSNTLLIAALLTLGLVILVIGHTIQVWLWAAAFASSGALADFETAFYFATVTYTTLGYGDIVLAEDLRIFASFGAVTGLFAFGISTAFIIGIINEAMPSFRKD
ncbi:MAG: ion channel [Pseudomonadota bacterium]